jgi:L-alanine-DL-glutamate epimerase-like enolase superfamily enzyme
MKIIDIRPTTVTVPLEAPLRHSNGAHWGRFVRTVVEVETDEGITGLGEMGGGGESAALAFAGLKSYLIGHDPFDLNRMRYAICNPTASLYNNRTQLHAALEFACLDIIGKNWVYRFISSWVAGFAMRLGSRAISSIAIQITSPAPAKFVQLINLSATPRR